METFSLLYVRKANKGNNTHAVDWDWLSKSKWARSDKEGSRWYPTEGLDQEAYWSLLESFGLETYSNELPVEKVLTMNPATLIAVRREKEKLNGLEKIEVVSITAGNHISADDFGK